PGLGSLLVVDALGAGPRALRRRAEVLDVLVDTIDQGRGESKRGRPRSRSAGGRKGAKGSRSTSTSEQRSSLTAEGVVGAVLSVIHARLLERQTAVAATGAVTATGASSNGKSSGTATRERAGDHRERAGNRGSRSVSAGALSGLLNPLMSMIVMPYLGQSAARRELERPPPAARDPRPSRHNPLQDLDMRLTYKTVRVLLAIAQHPGASNRQIGEDAGVQDQGQISKLLGRLHKLGLIQNTG